jgi:hypothetical protein
MGDLTNINRPNGEKRSTALLHLGSLPKAGGQQIGAVVRDLIDKSRGPFLTSPLGTNLDPRGEVVPRG